MRVRVVLLSVVAALVAVGSVHAQSSGEPALPESPSAPETIVRHADGRATIRAVAVSAPLRVDGRLDEAVYTGHLPVSDFIQTEPSAGEPATEKTEVWVLFDRNHVYISVRCWESEPARMVVNEMRRDGQNIGRQENVAFLLDTFHDGRNGFVFNVNPLGGRADGQTSNERQYNIDWNPVWEAAVGRFEGGWTVEAAIPFKSLRYRPGASQVWGFNMRRTNRWKNEMSYITRIPNALGSRGLYQGSLAATLVGLVAPAGSRNLEIKPYAISTLRTDRNSRPSVSNDPGADAGLDVKYGLTQNLTADFTYNTDFAQAEADEQQVNLTRFSLFYPEKREFFLENQGIFAFGGAAATDAAAGSDTPILFYSRRVGLSEGRAVPIEAGGRVTGRIGKYSVGGLVINSDDEPESGAPGAAFSILRLKRDVMRRSAIGVIATHRSAQQQGGDGSSAYGVDGSFGFFDNVLINTYWARTHTSGLAGDDTSYRLQFDYAGDRYGLQAERLSVGEDFNPAVGFVRRDDMRRTFGQFRFSPRPRASAVVRRYSWIGSIARVEDGRGRLETRAWDGEFAIEFQNSDRLGAGYERTYELLIEPFPIASGVTVPVGQYEFGTSRVTYLLGLQRRVSGTLVAEHGTFYGGRKTALAFSRTRMVITPKLSIEPTVSVNRVELAGGSFTASVGGGRVIFTPTRSLFVTALIQYNSDAHDAATNVRLRWEYRPGSELFIVYNDQRDTRARGIPRLINRAVIVKVNRLLRF